MKERLISFIEAQQILEILPEQFTAECPSVVIARNNRPVLSVMPYEAYQALLANLESLQTLLTIMAGKDMRAQPRPNRIITTCPRSLSWEEFQREVGWE